MTHSLKVAVGIATIGRPQVVADTLRFVRSQSRRPDDIIVCAPTEADVAGLAGNDVRLIVLGEKGLPRQRNAILDAAVDADILIFFDDDFIPASNYLEVVEAAHRRDPSVVMTTGLVLRDGILGPGLTLPEAEAAIAEVADEPLASSPDFPEVYNGYGCNMSILMPVARAQSLRFDPELPLYAWWEDVDFSRRLAVHGRIVRVRQARGVHLGVKKGRQSGLKLGYSQVANPLYLLRKGSCTPQRVAAQIARNVLANMAKILFPEAYIDRRGRVMGNLLAVADLLKGRLSPGRIIDL